MKFKTSYIGFLIVMLTGISFTACEEHLEEEVFSAFTSDQFFENVSSAEQGLMGIYDRLGSEQLYSRGYLLYFQSSDLSRYWRQNRGNDDDLMCNYQIQENNNWIGSAWAAFYDGINRANLVIDKVTLLKDALENSGNRTANQESDLEEYKAILGEAHFLRAFMYFQLVKNWGDVPFRLSSDVSLEDFKAERSPSKEVYEQIEKDMLLAIELLPDIHGVKSPGRIYKTAAQGILARIYLQWAGQPINDISKFEKSAEQALAVVNSGAHELNTQIDPLDVGAPFDHPFPQVFKNLTDHIYDLKESMWEIHFSYVGESREDASVVGVWHGVTSNTKSTYKRGAPRWYPLPSFYDSFEADDTLRRDWSISQFEIKSNDSFVAVDRDALKWGVGKYRRYLLNVKSPNNNYETLNWQILRYADVLLMLGESINETLMNGGTLPPGTSLDLAYESVNKVRRRARALDPDSPATGVDLSGSGGEIFRQQIRNERAWELCFEGHRRYDLMRWGILVDAIRQAGQDMAAIGYSDQNDYFQAHNIQDKHVLLPIPFNAEISQNPNILNTDPTNNGYR
ncbi:MAG: RagB/SusD family nutrient uptake outer membrane protein [Cytophagales bacterium]|nr:RagB/SusD family nutrient uptake outer membrane protein [Cytophagales bacterium]